MPSSHFDHSMHSASLNFHARCSCTLTWARGALEQEYWQHTTILGCRLPTRRATCRSAPWFLTHRKELRAPYRLLRSVFLQTLLYSEGCQSNLITQQEWFSNWSYACGTFLFHFITTAHIWTNTAFRLAKDCKNCHTHCFSLLQRLSSLYFTMIMVTNGELPHPESVSVSTQCQWCSHGSESLLQSSQGPCPPENPEIQLMWQSPDLISWVAFIVCVFYQTTVKLQSTWLWYWDSNVLWASGMMSMLFLAPGGAVCSALQYWQPQRTLPGGCCAWRVADDSEWLCPSVQSQDTKWEQKGSREERGETNRGVGSRRLFLTGLLSSGYEDWQQHIYC